MTSTTIDQRDFRAAQVNEAMIAAISRGDCTALPDDFKVYDIERFLPVRRRFRGKLNTTSIGDFTGYLAHRTNAPEIYIDTNRMSASCILDLGDIMQPGHCEHEAKLALSRTAEYQALLSIVDGSMSQQSFAEWVEEWRDCIVFEESLDGEEIPAIRAIQTIRTIDIKASREVGSDVGDFNAKRTTSESIEAKSRDGKLPGWMRFECKPYDDLSKRTFVCRVSLITGDKPSFKVRIQSHGVIEREIGEEFATLLAKEIDGCAPIIGTFDPK